jgi:hypothetical protein
MCILAFGLVPESRHAQAAEQRPEEKIVLSTQSAAIRAPRPFSSPLCKHASNDFLA